MERARTTPWMLSVSPAPKEFFLQCQCFGCHPGSWSLLHWEEASQAADGSQVPWSLAWGKTIHSIKSNSRKTSREGNGQNSCCSEEFSLSQLLSWGMGGQVKDKEFPKQPACSRPHPLLGDPGCLCMGQCGPSESPPYSQSVSRCLFKGIGWEAWSKGLTLLPGCSKNSNASCEGDLSTQSRQVPSL